MIRAEWTNNDALSAEQTTHSNAPNTLNALDCISRKERVMKNADKFKGIFGIYATELWAKQEKEFLEWLNEDVPERNVGKWIEEDDGIIHGYCSNCGWMAIWQETDVFGMNYCPNCGADMSGRREDE